MTMHVLERLTAERDEARSAAVALAEADNFNPEDQTYLELKSRAAELDRRVTELAELVEARQASDALDGRLSKASKAREVRTDPGAPQQRGSWGETFVRSDAFTNYGRHGQSRKVEIEERALPTGIGDLPDSILSRPTSVSVQPPVAPTPLLDAITRVQVSGNAVEYVSWAKVAGGAATVAEKAAKPSAEFAPTVTPATLEMIAVYTQLTRQLIEDAASVRDLIDGELRREVNREEEEHAAAALAAAVIPPFVGPASGGLIGAIRGGVGEVQGKGYAPNAVLLNPADWAELDVDVMGGTLNGPVIGQRFWGLTPIPSSTQPAGTAVVGDFRTAVQHFYRSQINLFVTDSHADTFLSNVFTLLAERRSLTAVVRPQALAEVSVGA